jgi:hypothetical protein
MWQVDAVCRRPVERPVLLIVMNGRPRYLEDFLCALYCIPVLCLALDRRQAVDLLPH